MNKKWENITREERDIRNSYLREYYKKNKDRILKRRKELVTLESKEKQHARGILFYSKNRERILELAKIKNKPYYESKKLYFSQKRKELITKRREELINLYGGKCVKCGYSDHRALQFDHINGDGSIDKKNGIRNVKLYNEIKNNRNRFQLLCANCNWIKRYENNELAGPLTKQLLGLPKL